MKNKLKMEYFKRKNLQDKTIKKSLQKKWRTQQKTKGGSVKKNRINKNLLSNMKKMNLLPLMQFQFLQMSPEEFLLVYSGKLRVLV